MTTYKLELELFLVVAGMFLTRAFCPWKLVLRTPASKQMLLKDHRLTKNLETKRMRGAFRSGFGHFVFGTRWLG